MNHATGQSTDRADTVDETSERWVTAVHEAGHATVADYYGARVAVCRIRDDDTSGLTRHNAFGVAHAVVAVAGERATRLLLGVGGGSTTDYADAHTALARADVPAGIHITLTRVEALADAVITTHRRDLLRTARQLYRTGSR